MKLLKLLLVALGVLSLYACLESNKVTHQSLFDQIELNYANSETQDGVISNFHLPKISVKGVKIEWLINDESVISLNQNEVIIHRSDKDETATIRLSVDIDGKIREKVFTFTVLKDETLVADTYHKVFIYDGESSIEILVKDGETLPYVASSKVGYIYLGIYEDETFNTPFTNEPIKNDTNLYLNYVLEDMTAPVIVGAKDITFYIGDELDLESGIAATDNSGNVTLTIDASNLDLTKKGTYFVYYIAKDAAQNETIVTIQVTVVEKSSTNPGELLAYYNTAAGKTGQDLLLSLRSIISKSGSIGYSSTSYVLEDSDESLTNPGMLYLIYDSRLTKNVWDGASSWNKEHVWPQSKLGNASKSDLHNLRASTVSVNSQRGNLAFRDGSGGYKTISGGFYPGDDHKGDVARIILYMHVRWNLSITSGTIGDLNMFLRWHQEDPVNDFERSRNQITFESQQGNRNPFIDHPEFAQMIWSNQSLSTNTVDTTPFVLYTDLVHYSSIYQA